MSPRSHTPSKRSRPKTVSPQARSKGLLETSMQCGRKEQRVLGHEGRERLGNDSADLESSVEKRKMAKTEASEVNRVHRRMHAPNPVLDTIGSLACSAGEKERRKSERPKCPEKTEIKHKDPNPVQPKSLHIPPTPTSTVSQHRSKEHRSFLMQIQGLDIRVAQEDLKEIHSVRLAADSSGCVTRTATVGFGHLEDAQRAVRNLDGRTVDGRIVSATLLDVSSSGSSASCPSTTSDPAAIADMPSPHTRAPPPSTTVDIYPKIPSVGTSQNSQKSITSKWLSFVDKSTYTPHPALEKDTIGTGDLHRKGNNFQPHPEQRKAKDDESHHHRHRRPGRKNGHKRRMTDSDMQYYRPPRRPEIVDDRHYRPSKIYVNPHIRHYHPLESWDMRAHRKPSDYFTEYSPLQRQYAPYPYPDVVHGKQATGMLEDLREPCTTTRTSKKLTRKQVKFKLDQELEDYWMEIGRCIKE
ncbi:uncharacterized protein SPPG_06647 [Spizellomyces punctatus DAOM BR117]|uniref:RRM domain-containing protein n=1 Tax=Spizellomyces punctatus (strain DAOM BR117) TaxID=645134 RepID=A0A0L0HBW8_SPIPD|nr:uncharacterized protein SPPG_06647 [Spizellomyces punctatus DAOM BR117]KNC98248.1 hypothetical protein SPPG_06647 [Spizellomyces punctatus DAOM BR117]|eukprot:XP_016606288.1 hypothetical protein SPPG_06647 [Spizellomyces punctatus DAOM BR117]